MAKAKKTITIKVDGKVIDTLTTTRDVKFAVVSKDSNDEIDKRIQMYLDRKQIGQNEINAIKRWEELKKIGYVVIGTSGRLDLAEKLLATKAKRNYWKNLFITSEIE